MNMKVIMVDLDGTLFDTRKPNYLAYAEALKEFGYKLDYDYYSQYCNGRHYLDFLPKITTKDPQILAKIHRIKKEKYKSYVHQARLNQPLINMLTTLRSAYKLALVTTASRQNVQDILASFGLMDFFDLILSQEDISHPKPNPEGFNKAMQFFNAAPAECIIFEDSDVGIEAAQRSGCAVFTVKGYN